MLNQDGIIGFLIAPDGELCFRDNHFGDLSAEVMIVTNYPPELTSDIEPARECRQARRPLAAVARGRVRMARVRGGVPRRDYRAIFRRPNR